MKFKLGVNCDLTGVQVGVEEEINRVMEMGFDVIYCDGGVCNMSREDFDTVRKALASAGARVWSVHSTLMCPELGCGADEVIDGHKKILERAQALGARCLTHHPGQWQGLGEKLCQPELMLDMLRRMPEGYVYRLHVEILRDIVERADHYGIEPTIENMPIHFGGGLFSDPDELVKLADEAGVGICMDMGHAVFSGFEPLSMLNKFGHRLKETHFNDSFGHISGDYAYDDVHMPAGIGLVNWPAVIYMLEKIDYTRPVVFEQGGPQSAKMDRLALSEITLKNWRIYEEFYEKFPPIKEYIEEYLVP